jgi:hypothetical protein
MSLAGAAGKRWDVLRVGVSVTIHERPAPLNRPRLRERVEFGQRRRQLSSSMRLLTLTQEPARLLECLRLRVKDIDFGSNQIVVREGKGNKDRVTMLPAIVKAPLLSRVEDVRTLYEHDLGKGFGSVYLPDGLRRKYPMASKAWGWQWAFPSSRVSVDPRSGERRRHHVDGSVPQRVIKQSARWYDACAVMVRRVLEALIVESFEKHGIAVKIKNAQGDFLYLRDLIDVCLREPSWNLTRNCKQAMPRLKDIGDKSAHSRRYIAHRGDIDPLLSEIRLVVQELVYLAGLK